MTDASLRRAAEITVSACHLDTLHGENLGSTNPSWGARGGNGPPNAAWPRKTRKGSYLQVRGNNDCITAGQSPQVDNFKKISSWAAILFAPTLVGTIYGMNFDRMPELHWVLGYPFAIVLMAVVCTSLYVIFKRKDWL